MRSYTMLTLQGSSDAMRAFLAGWSAGRGMKRDDLRRRVLWPKDWRIQAESTMRGVVEALTRQSDFEVLLASEWVDEVVTALGPWSRRLDLQLLGQVPIRAAYFDFEFEIFARDQAADVRSIFEALPEGVNVSSDYNPVETSDMSASGAEMYAPAHDYKFQGKGTVGGDLRGVLEVHERARRHERIRTSDVKLRFET